MNSELFHERQKKQRKKKRKKPGLEIIDGIFMEISRIFCAKERIFSQMRKKMLIRHLMITEWAFSCLGGREKELFLHFVSHS